MSERARDPEESGGEVWTAALAGLRGELRRRLGGTTGAPEDEADGEAPQLDWVALVEDLRRRLGQLGMRERSGEVGDFGLAPETIRSARPLLQLLRRRWWRIEVVGLEHVPADRPVLFVANHSGLLPWDGLALAEIVEEAHLNGRLSAVRKQKGLAEEDDVFFNGLLAWPRPPSWRRPSSAGTTSGHSW